ncbi:MAG: hypothetical protein OSJ62_00430 [Lachnospiraceae bacterium]|nr:hypothetical protein [Lachnospiraceae bacterium]
MPQYYVEGSHDAIIGSAEWQLVQTEMQRRKNAGRRETQHDLFSGFLSGLEEVRELSVDFSEKLFHRMVDYATVYSDGRVVFTFRNGAEVSTEI